MALALRKGADNPNIGLNSLAIVLIGILETMQRFFIVPIKSATSIHCVAKLPVNCQGLLCDSARQTKPSEAEVVQEVIFKSHVILQLHAEVDGEAAWSNAAAESCDDIGSECRPVATAPSYLIRVSLTNPDHARKDHVHAHANVRPASAKVNVEVILACVLLPLHWSSLKDLVYDMLLVEPGVEHRDDTEDNVGNVLATNSTEGCNCVPIVASVFEQ